MNKQQMREAMPATAAFIDKAREKFGADIVNAAIRGGLQGQGTFYSEENGQVIGSVTAKAQSMVGWDARGRAFSFDVPAGLTPQQVQELTEAELEKANLRVMTRRGFATT